MSLGNSGVTLPKTASAAITQEGDAMQWHGRAGARSDTHVTYGQSTKVVMQLSICKCLTPSKEMYCTLSVCTSSVTNTTSWTNIARNRENTVVKLILWIFMNLITNAIISVGNSNNNYFINWIVAIYY